MSDLPLPPPPGPISGPTASADADRDAETVVAVLTRRGSQGLNLGIRALHRTIELICVAALLTGLVALLLGIWAWHSSLPGALVAVLAGGPTVAVAIYVIVRTRGLATAVKQPAQTLAQAQDLVLRAKGSPELHKLAGGIRAGKAAKRAGVGRVRRSLQTGRLISAVIGLASPDPERHDLIIPFTPARLKFLWLAITVGLWCWLVSAVMASIAFLSLAVQALT